MAASVSGVSPSSDGDAQSRVTMITQMQTCYVSRDSSSSDGDTTEQNDNDPNSAIVTEKVPLHLTRINLS